VSAQPTLLFCVGATKAGTTWLHRHLAGHPECHVRAIKELHYFDTVETGLWRRSLRRERARRAGLAAPKHAAARRDVSDWIAVLRRKALDLPAYLAYLTGGCGQRRLVADITPAYASLPEARLAQMASLLPDVRFLYLLRDPVARFWSHVRMIALRETRDPAAVPDRARAIMAAVLAGQPSAVADRGDYAAAVTRLRRVVPEGRCLFLPTDEMMTAEGLARLWAFLGIGRARADFARRPHEGVPVPLTAAERSALRHWLAPQYAFVEAMLGGLPRGWQPAGEGVVA
jgi:hypothetical protein